MVDVPRGGGEGEGGKQQAAVTIGWMEGSLTTFTFLRDFTRIGSYFFMLLSASFSSSKLPRSSLATVPVASGRGRLGPYLPRVPGAAELRPTSALYLLPVARPHGGRLCPFSRATRPRDISPFPLAMIDPFTAQVTARSKIQLFRGGIDSSSGAAKRRSAERS